VAVQRSCACDCAVRYACVGVAGVGDAVVASCTHAPLDYCHVRLLRFRLQVCVGCAWVVRESVCMSLCVWRERVCVGVCVCREREGEREWREKER
jgi:hypothetical protein